MKTMEDLVEGKRKVDIMAGGAGGGAEATERKGNLRESGRERKQGAFLLLAAR